MAHQHALLGLVQGLTEFLPVSSSGHLVLAGYFFKIPSDVAFDVLLHLSSAAAICIYFRSEILGILLDFFSGLRTLLFDGPAEAMKRPGFRLGLFIIAGSVPAAAIGIPFQDRLEAFFSLPLHAAACLLITGTILFATRWAPDGTMKEGDIGWGRSIGIGLAQALALLPGISRSGSTISAALFLGVERSAAASYSFLLALPAIGGAALLKLKVLLKVPAEAVPAYAAGAAVSFVISLLALKILFQTVRSRSFSAFSYYCWAVGVAILILSQYGQ